MESSPDTDPGKSDTTPLQAPSPTSATAASSTGVSAQCAARFGRRRDVTIDDRILVAARRQLACRGYEGMSLASVAEEACTTRQALYRRWQDKAALAADAIATHQALDELCVSADPRADLEQELREFERTMAAPEQRSLAGTMLQDGTDAHSRAEYARRVIAPRLERIRVILEHARALGLIEDTADVDVAMTLPTGAWYERHLGGLPTPDGWATRSATLIWRALGGAH
jgi:AcrR family transcriptional regulator